MGPAPIPIETTPRVPHVRIVGGTARQRLLLRRFRRELGPSAVELVRIVPYRAGRKEMLVVQVRSPRGARPGQQPALRYQADLYVGAVQRAGRRFGFHDVGRVAIDVRAGPSAVRIQQPSRDLGIALSTISRATARAAGTRVLETTPAGSVWAIGIRVGGPRRAVSEITRTYFRVAAAGGAFIQARNRCGRVVYSFGYVDPLIGCAAPYRCLIVPNYRRPPPPLRWPDC